MKGYDEGYPGLGRLVGSTRGETIRMIEPHRGALGARNRVAAALSAAMMKGDVEAVVAALTLLGVRTVFQDMPHGWLQSRSA
jgi:hypothetical protein